MRATKARLVLATPGKRIRRRASPAGKPLVGGRIRALLVVLLFVTRCAHGVILVADVPDQVLARAQTLFRGGNQQVYLPLQSYRCNMRISGFMEIRGGFPEHPSHGAPGLRALRRKPCSRRRAQPDFTARISQRSLHNHLGQHGHQLIGLVRCQILHEPGDVPQRPNSHTIFQRRHWILRSKRVSNFLHQLPRLPLCCHVALCISLLGCPCSPALPCRCLLLHRSEFRPHACILFIIFILEVPFSETLGRTQNSLRVQRRRSRSNHRFASNGTRHVNTRTSQRPRPVRLLNQIGARWRLLHFSWFQKCRRLHLERLFEALCDWVQHRHSLQNRQHESTPCYSDRPFAIHAARKDAVCEGCSRACGALDDNGGLDLRLW
mmetsp:Transcript_42818/g.97594  ORF Transcript_42818/g.97594 Transcript_42818/m.97594 type:complete len:378 (-) Transcript_42818:854-1987(-)